MSSIAYATLWVFVFSIPWGSVVIIESGVNLVGRLTGMVAVALAVLAVTVSGRFRRLDAYHVAAIAFMGWIVIQQLVFFKTGSCGPTSWDRTSWPWTRSGYRGPRGRSCGGSRQAAPTPTASR